MVLDRKYSSNAGGNRGDDEDDDIGQLAQDANSSIPIVTPSDGEFSSFPEIHKRTVEVLKAKGYNNLFPIQ